MATIKLVMVVACFGVALVLGAAAEADASLEIERVLAALQAMLADQPGNMSVDEPGDKPGNKSGDQPLALWTQLAEAQLVRLNAALHHQVEETKKAVLAALHHTQQQVEQFRAAHPELERHVQAAVSRAAAASRALADVSAAAARARDSLAPAYWGASAAAETAAGTRR